MSAQLQDMNRGDFYDEFEEEVNEILEGNGEEPITDKYERQILARCYYAHTGASATARQIVDARSS